MNSKKVKLKHTILFISSDDNYFVKDHPSHLRMYSNLIFFYKHKDFRVIVLQNDRNRHKEDKSLKKNITCYYYKELRIFNNSFVHFLDFNPFYISRVIKILKKHRIDLIHVEFPYGIIILRFLTKTPISYNTHNVETIYWKYIAKNYYKIPRFLRAFYAKFIYLLEKGAIKFATNINACSLEDKKEFISFLPLILFFNPAVAFYCYLLLGTFIIGNIFLYERNNLVIELKSIAKLIVIMSLLFMSYIFYLISSGYDIINIINNYFRIFTGKSIFKLNIYQRFNGIVGFNHSSQKLYFLNSTPSDLINNIINFLIEPKLTIPALTLGYLFFFILIGLLLRVFLNL